MVLGQIRVLVYLNKLLILAGTTPFDSNPAQPKDFDPTGWELALVTTPSSDLSAAQERQLVSPLNPFLKDIVFKWLLFAFAKHLRTNM